MDGMKVRALVLQFEVSLMLLMLREVRSRVTSEDLGMCDVVFCRLIELYPVKLICGLGDAVIMSCF